MQILSFEKNQSVTYLIARGTEEEIREKLEKLSPKVLDLIPLTLEEVFIYEMEGMGYDFKGIE